MEFPDVTIAVKNTGKVNWEMLWDGRKYQYPVGKIVTIPYLVAYEHFGVELKGGRLIRDRRPVKDDGEQTKFASKLSSILPQGLSDYGNNKYANMAEFEKHRESFTNGFEFGVQPRTSGMAPELFEKFRTQVEVID